MPSSATVRSGIAMPFTDRIKFGFSSAQEIQVEDIQYGGGYEYSYLNANAYQTNVMETYDLTWMPLSKAEVNTLCGALAYAVIYWVPDFDQGSEYWRLKQNFTITQIAAATYQVEATIRSYHTNVTMTDVTP